MLGPDALGILESLKGRSVSQSRRHSALEAVSSTAIGFLVTWLAGLVIYPMAGVPVSVGQNTLIVLLFTIVSLIRGYCIRRWFDRYTGGQHARSE